MILRVYMRARINRALPPAIKILGVIAKGDADARRWAYLGSLMVSTINILVRF
jgi:hypothetical protein